MSSTRAGSLHFEQEDATYGSSYNYSLMPGDTFLGSLGEDGDRADGMRMRLAAGETYTITIEGQGADALTNPLMRINFGRETLTVARSTDGNSATYTFTAQETGTYTVLAIAGGRGGDYKLSVAGGSEPTPPPPPTPTVITEADDAAFSMSSKYSMEAGEKFVGTFASRADRDIVKVELEEGETYSFTMKATNADGESDALIALFNEVGNRMVRGVERGEDGMITITYTAEKSGTYYVKAQTYGQNSSTNYELTMNHDSAAPLPPAPPLPAGWWNNDQIAHQLTNDYWEAKDWGRVAFDVKPGGTLTVNLDDVLEQNRPVFLRALEAWSQVTGIQFQAVDGEAQITFSDQHNGAYANGDSDPETGVIKSSFVNVSAWWIGVNGRGVESYAYQTAIHEIGHALGLGHAGNYNGGAKYGKDQLYPNDSFQATVMSYFDQKVNTEVSADKAYLATPMIADILAMQDLYGVAGNIRTESTVYGENSTAGGYYDEIANHKVAFTILDDGGHDTINFSSVAADQKISLIAETYSDVNGLKGNMAIMRGTVIEDAYTGSGNDRLIGNHADNGLFANAGNDVLEGAKGNDVLSGGTGEDKFIFNANDGNDEIIDFEDGLDLIVFDSGAQSMSDLQISQDGDNALIAYDGGVIQLTNVDSSLLTQDDFLFV